VTSPVSPRPEIVLVLAEDPAAARRAALELLDEWRRQHVGAAIVEAPPAPAWPFRFPLSPPLPHPRVLVTAAAIHDAFVNHQTGATRLVTTQPMYLMEEWSAALAAHGDARLVAWAALDAVRTDAPEILARRGIFARMDVRHISPGVGSPESGVGNLEPGVGRGPARDEDSAATLAAAFRASDPADRLARCVDALRAGRTAPALVATASACMEVNDLAAAARDLDEAIALAPSWAAPHFERGKAWLRADDMDQAGRCFRAAAERLPAFGPAWANLGATQGELDRPDEALDAFERARAADPDSPQAVNNVGVVSRELGRLADSEAAFRRVIQLAPDQAFGYYNLGHTLFLQGRYHAALTAYLSGQSRDPGRNAVQASRLAMCRLATGDSAGALADLQRSTMLLPRDARRQLLGDTSAIVWALTSQHPGLEGWGEVQGWLQKQLREVGGSGD
jgi:tetratricopeptide (TPR) repeat protein